MAAILAPAGESGPETFRAPPPPGLRHRAVGAARAAPGLAEARVRLAPLIGDCLR